MEDLNEIPPNRKPANVQIPKASKSRNAEVDITPFATSTRIFDTNNNTSACSRVRHSDWPIANWVIVGVTIINEPAKGKCCNIVIVTILLTTSSKPAALIIPRCISVDWNVENFVEKLKIKNSHDFFSVFFNPLKDIKLRSIFFNFPI